MDPSGATEEQHIEETINVVQSQSFSPVTSRYVKKQYKISLADFISQNEDQKKNSETLNAEAIPPSKPNEYDIDCPRCFMIQTGNKLLSESIKYVASVIMPRGRHDLYEPAETIADNEELSDETITSGDGLTIMAISTSIAAGSEIASRVSQLNEGPAKMIAERRIMESPKLKLAQHTCLVAGHDINDTAIITVSGKPRVKCELPFHGELLHVVIYAPSGTGKTEFQRRLAAQDCLLYDTDDIPGVNGQELENILQKGSVVTNRLDLLQSAPYVIAFLPNSADDLRRHTEHWRLTNADYEHWYSCNQNVRLPQNALVIHYSKTYLSEWFVETQKSPPGRIMRGVEKDVLKYIRSQEEAMSKLFKGHN